MLNLKSTAIAGILAFCCACTTPVKNNQSFVSIDNADVVSNESNLRPLNRKFDGNSWTITLDSSWVTQFNGLTNELEGTSFTAKNRGTLTMSIDVYDLTERWVLGSLRNTDSWDDDFIDSNEYVVSNMDDFVLIEYSDVKVEGSSTRSFMVVSEQNDVKIVSLVTTSNAHKGYVLICGGSELYNEDTIKECKRALGTFEFK
jgi:hypothetical protein